MNLGTCDICFPTADLRKSMEFYEKLGFERQQGDDECTWAVMVYGSCRIALYQGDISTMMLNFRGGDVAAIIDELKTRGITPVSDTTVEADGSVGAVIRDPDGNVLYFNTHPDERQ